MAPSVSYSITVRLEVASRGRAVSEVDPDVAIEHAAVVATGRSDYPNQINNVLAFPGVFRGLLDAQSRLITDDMLIAAAQALADVVSPDEIGPHYIIPSVFHPDVASSVAVAVADAATQNSDR
jgi:malate dehydrogenase (oxaloacetate-decarboxylating)